MVKGTGWESPRQFWLLEIFRSKGVSALARYSIPLAHLGITSRIWGEHKDINFKHPNTFFLMATRNLLHGSITLSEAKEKASNVVHQLEFPQLQRTFFQRLERQRPHIRALVAHHLGVDLAKCEVSPPEYWRHGSFNVCVPAQVNVPNPDQPRFVMVRFPLPYRVGETTRPGNADEKLRCEAATYAWLQENCPSIPIPHLYGVGLATGQQVWLAAYSLNLES